MTRRRTRGFTLMEILIAMALTTIVTASVLAIVRTQLSAFEMNDQLVRTQQNARAAMDFVESTLRRACGGVAAGPIGVNTLSVHKQVDCFQWTDSAKIDPAGFSKSGTGLSDAVEVVYASGTMTALSAAPTLSSSATIQVNDVTGFAKDDLVLITDYSTGYLMQIASNPVTTATTRPAPGTITLTSTATTLPSSGAPTLSVGTPVFKASTYSFFVVPTDAASNYAGMLMVDPNGVTSTNHLDYGGAVQPAVEGVVDFQVAVGQDSDANGYVVENLSAKGTDEWIGNDASESALPASPWNIATTYPQLRQVRLSLMLQTLNKYAGAAGTLTPFENRSASSYPANGASVTYGPRYRSVSMVVAPRTWNLNE